MLRTNTSGLFICVLAVVMAAAPALAAPTEITVRVLSRDAKFIGSSMDGAMVTLSDADTGEVLAEGKTEGGTGDTGLLMKSEQTRRDPLSSDGAAKFSATLDISEPRRIEVTAVGPLNNPDGANRVSATQWVIPGKHLTGGDGWVLDMPGFSVKALAPADGAAFTDGSGRITFEAEVMMMCGCPIEPGGMWNADGYEVRALLKRNGKPAGEVELTYAGTTSKFSGAVDVSEAGDYEAVIYAYDADTGNTGLDRVAFTVGDE